MKRIFKARRLALATNFSLAALAGLLFAALGLLSRADTAGAEALPAFGAVYTGRGGCVSLVVHMEWDAQAAEGILETAREHGAGLTFALPPNVLERNVRLARSILLCGCELAVTGESAEEIARSVRLIEGLGGRTRVFLRTRGADPAAERAARSLGLTVVSGSRDLLCLRGSGAELAERAAASTRGGDIVLCAPTAAFADALPYILRDFKGMGLTAVTVSGTIYD